MVAARIANLPRGGIRAGNPKHEIQTANWQFEPVSQADAAERLNVSERSVARSKAVIENGAPELIVAVERGEVAVSTAADLL